MIFIIFAPMSVILEISNQHFILLNQKAVFWKEKEMLVIADLHLGKTSHFRKHGIAISHQSAVKDLEKLHDLIIEYTPLSIIFLGDLFHSDYNKEWESFIELRSFFPHVSFILVKGNHDIINPELHSKNYITLYESLNIDGFLFSHEKMKNEKCIFQFYGHTHPGIKIKGSGKLSLKLPCFAQKENALMLPAFGALTGLHLIHQKDYDKIYVVGNEKIYCINPNSAIEI
ncbi:MAG: ligase-associated DNA damage response endonuclease PdeM [Bacteroidia bacterium]